MQYAVKDLEGALLDAAVAKAEGLSTEIVEGVCFVVRSVQRWHMSCGVKIPAGFTEQATPFRPSTDGRDGMPILEREGIAIYRVREGWAAVMPGSGGGGYVGDSGYIDVDIFDGECGAMPLIAAFRAFCASRFGETVELP